MHPETFRLYCNIIGYKLHELHAYYKLQLHAHFIGYILLFFSA